jgi:hypothetical protein
MVGADPNVRFVIDADGRLWSPAAAEFHRLLGYPEPDFDLARYAVRNLGYVLLEISAAPDGLLIIEFRACLVKPAALAEAQRFMKASGASGGFGLRYLLADWTEETFGSADAAIARINALTAAAEFRAGRSHLISEQVEVDRLFHQPDHRLKPLFQLWRASFNRFTEATLPFLVQHGYDERMVIVERDRGSDAHRFRYVGAGFTFYEEAERLKLIGTDLREQPDRTYGEWIANAYSQASQTMRPLFEEVDAVIRPPGRPPRRSRYERLLVPFSTAEGDVLIIGSSVLSPELDAPVNTQESK